MTTLLIADDHPLFREALRGAASRVLPGAQVHEADNASGLFALVDHHPDADLLLLDLNMPGVQGFSALIYLRAQHPQLPVVMVSAREERTIMRRALDHGAMGFIPKSTDAATIGAALLRVLDGDRWIPDGLGHVSGISREEQQVAARVRELTPQQFRVLQMLATGLLNKQIAWELGISEATVKAHMTAILRKLGANNRTQAVLIANRLAIDPETVAAVRDDEEAVLLS